MFIKLFIISFLFIFPAFADDFDAPVKNSSYQTVDEMMTKHQNIHPTDCSSKIFIEALEKGAEKIIQENEYEDTIEEDSLQIWARRVILDADVLKQIQKCPEVANISDTDTVIFSPVKYTFPWGQSVTVNYTTQPKVIKQKIQLAEKPSLPTDDASPKLMDPNDPAKYINTDPAWYAVMVVQHGSLNDFVGKDKNNIVSVKWINDNIDKVYPKGYWCTSRSAWANDKDTINQVVREVVDLEEDSNDYYVAGDIDLRWVMWAEITLDAVLTVATLGGSQAVTSSIRSIRAVKTMKNLIKNMKALEKFTNVKKYAKIADKLAKTTSKADRLAKNLDRAKDYEKVAKEYKTAKKNKDLVKSQELQKKLDDIFAEAKKIDPKLDRRYMSDPSHMEKTINNLRKEAATLEKQTSGMLDDVAKQIKEKEKLLKEAKKADKAADVQKYEKELEELKGLQQYTENAGELKSMLKYLDDLKAFGRPQTGNVITRPFKKIGAAYKTYKAINSAKNAAKIAKASKVARAGMGTFSAKAKDWLFHTSLKFGEKLVKFEQNMGALTGFLYVLGDFYDQTSTTSEKYSNGIAFKPFCLLSADDIEGEDNEVGYGTFLRWTGNSTLPQDDDAAYLQVIDFTEKFSDSLNEFQSKNGAECNVDIYIVRPIIRLDESDPNKTKGDLFYLIMNDIPWSTSEQFNQVHTNITEWEQQQESLKEQNPKTLFQKRPEPGAKQNTNSTSQKQTAAE